MTRPMLRILAILCTLLLAQTVNAETISGKVIGDHGEPVAGLDVWLDDITKPDCYCAEHADRTRADGSFSIANAPRANYAVRVLPHSPYRGAYARADARDGDVRNLTIVTSVLRDSVFPDDPPRASRIATTIIDDTNVRVDGSAGAVPPRTFVSIFNLETAQFMRGESDASGAFSLTIPALPASSLLVKSDRSGVPSRNQIFVTEVNDSMSGVPGTIVRVPAGADGLAFDVAGLVSNSGPPLWRLTGRMSGNRFANGDALSVSGTMRVDSSVPLPSQFNVNVTLTMERLTDFAGNDTRGDAVFASTLLTPTGFAIEHSQQGSSMNTNVNVAMTATTPQHAEVPIALTLPIPESLSAGLFRPYVVFYFDNSVVALAPTVHLRTGSDTRFARLPAIRIGNPAQPRLTTMLLVDTASGGTRGIRAAEDFGRFNLASRIATQTDTIVVPRADRITGTLLRYRLEPFAPTISRGTRGEPPEIPRVAFRFPSGSLTTTIRRPDGAVDAIGPAPFVQSRSRSIVDYRSQVIDGGGSHISDMDQLSTMDPRFEYAFPADGRYEIELRGSIDDVDGNTWSILGSYTLHVGEELIVDSAVQSGTPFEVGDSFDPAITIFPAIEADVEVRFRLGADERFVRGKTNRFGWFRPPSSSFVIDKAGEYRVDVSVTARDADRRYWAGFRTWGGVVAPRSSTIVGHGRRGINPQPGTPQTWYLRSQVVSGPIGSTHEQYPFHSGDVMWEEDGGAVLPIVTYQDTTGTLAEILRPRANNYPDFESQARDGETPLFIDTATRNDPMVDPAFIDVWGYSYRTIVRPLVRVREIIGEDLLPAGVYWHFNAQYGGQFGNGWHGDLPNDFKFQFGGAVLRGSLIGEPRYAVYASLFMLIPNGDPAGTRVFPPFQGNGGGPTGGPLLTLKGKTIEAFFHPTAIRAGSILEVGDTASLTGQAAPTLPASVTFVVTSPSGKTRTFAGRTNRIGYLHDPAHEFVVDESGEWRVAVTLTYDGANSAGPLQAPFPTGGILGGDGREFRFFVVERTSPRLGIDRAPWTFVRPADAPVVIDAIAPNLSSREMSRVVWSSGYILDELRDSGLSYSYDLRTLAGQFPNLDLPDQDGHAGADVVIVSLLVSGNDANGTKRYYAQQVLLRGEELLVPQPARRRSVRK